MAGKFTFIFLSLCLVSAIALPQKPVNQIGSLLDLLKKLIHSVEQILDNIISDINEAIDELGNDYDSFHSKVVDITREALLNIIRRFRPSFQEIAKRSSAAGQHLAQCIQDNDEKVINVAVDFFDATTSCASGEFGTMINSLKPIIKDLAGVQDDAKAAADQIDSCNDDKDWGCLAQVLLDLVQVITEIPDAVANDIGPVVESVEAYVKTMVQCYSDNKESYYTNAATALDSLATCAAA